MVHPVLSLETAHGDDLQTASTATAGCRLHKGSQLPWGLEKNKNWEMQHTRPDNV